MENEKQLENIIGNIQKKVIKIGSQMLYVKKKEEKDMAKGRSSIFS